MARAITTAFRDFAKEPDSYSAYISTHSLIDFVRMGSEELLERRLGHCRELLLFSKQVEQVERLLAAESAALALFQSYYDMGIFIKTPVRQLRALERYAAWRTLIATGRDDPGTWELSVRLELQTPESRMFLANVREAMPHPLLTDDEKERRLAELVGIRCA